MTLSILYLMLVRTTLASVLQLSRSISLLISLQYLFLNALVIKIVNGEYRLKINSSTRKVNSESSLGASLRLIERLLVRILSRIPLLRSIPVSVILDNTLLPPLLTASTTGYPVIRYIFSLSYIRSITARPTVSLKALSNRL